MRSAVPEAETVPTGIAQRADNLRARLVLIVTHEYSDASRHFAGHIRCCPTLLVSDIVGSAAMLANTAGFQIVPVKEGNTLLYKSVGPTASPSVSAC